MNAPQALAPMSLEEARAIVEAEDDSDSVRSLQAIATILRFNAISDPKLLGIAVQLEQVAGSMK